MPSLPTGTVTFLLTDIEGSTELLQRVGDRRYAEVLGEHRRVLRRVFVERNGQEIETQGDAVLVAFSRARDALGAAVAAQRALIKHPWPDGASLRVRMGLHTGEPVSETGGYVGLDVHRAARICAAGHGSQILVSQAVEILALPDLPPGASLRDLGNHRLKDLKGLEHLFQVVHPDLPTDFPPLKSLNVLPNNLPIQLTTFIGRAREMAELKRMLQITRLATLTGAGGCGKTRLAMQIAADLLDAYPDGVWVVDLAPLSDGALLPETVASVLGVTEHPGRPLAATLGDALRPQSLLLVLDSCEHLLDPCAHFADAILRGCPSVRILATSREALGIPGETLYRVPSLALPDPERLPSLDQLGLYDAVRLFVDRAMLSEPAFALTPSNAAAVARVAHRLDGIPLAIELAAMRTKALPVEVIAARLDDRFGLLTRGSRTSLPRHQTLQAAMDWSYALLSEPERMLLRRISVFAGEFTLEAAEQICAGTGIAEGDVLDLLTRLVEKSLAVFAGHGEARYRLLETVREYARARLREAGADVGVRRRHWNWYLALAQGAQAELRGPNQATWMERLAAEHDNLRAALGWAAEAREAELGLRLAVALGNFWDLRSYWSEGRKWLERLLVEAGEDAPASLRAEALRWAGVLAEGQDDYAAARSLLEESLRLFRETGDNTRGIADVCRGLGVIRGGQGDYEGARAFFEESLALYRELGDRLGASMALRNLAMAAVRLDNYQAARQYCTEALALARELGDTHGVAQALYFMGEAAARQGDYDEAAALYARSLALWRDLGTKYRIANVLTKLARVAQERGHHDDAAAQYGEALAICREIEDRWMLVFTLNDFGTLAQAQGDYGRAALLHNEALAVGQAIQNDWSVAVSLNRLGMTARCQDDYQQAIALQQQSLALSQKVHNRLGVCEAVEELGKVTCAQEDFTRAARFFGAAEALRAVIGAPLPPSHRVDYDRHVAALRTALGERTFASAWAEGREMSVDQVIQYATAGEVTPS